MEDALNHMAPCMFNYITDLSLVEIDPNKTISLSVSGLFFSSKITKIFYDKCDLCLLGHDMHSLLFAYMDEMLFKFCADSFVFKSMKIINLDKVNFKLEAEGFGESFDRTKHPQGTEIKAITYSNMQIHEAERTDIYVIVDI